MHQQQIIGQNQNLFYPNYGPPQVQNTNPQLINNQLQLQRQLQLQQNMQRNQQLQNIHNAQHLQKVQNIHNNQLYNAQKLQQTQFLQNNQNLQQAHKIQNPQNIYNLQPNQNFIPKQAVLGQDLRKTSNINHLQKNQINQPHALNQTVIQNMQQHPNPPQAQILRNTGKNQIPLPNNKLDLKLNSNSDAISTKSNHKKNNNTNNPQHYQQQQNEQLKKEEHNHINNEPIIENLKNTAILTTNDNLNNKNQNKVQPKYQIQNNLAKKSATFMTVNSLANLPYNAYPQAEFSSQHFFNICGYGSNSYNGKIKSYNEDMAKIIINYPKPVIINNKTISPNISYFGVFDGHGGDKCSKFLKENFDSILFNSPNFPVNPIESIREAFKNAEIQFSQKAIQNGKLVDKSGSCALIALIINDILYAINLGDSRALYSRDSGKEYYQITRDHKPNDEKEKRRIEKMGGKVYYANKTTINGVEVTLKEENYGKGFTFPYRLAHCGLAVARTIGDYYSKVPKFGGIKGTNIASPCINVIPIDEKSDFILLGCDGIYDRLQNEEILNKIWTYKKAGQSINDIHSLCRKIADAIIKYSMEKNSVDNVTVTFIAFKNFENKMKDPNFEYKCSTKCHLMEDNYDLSSM